MAQSGISLGFALVVIMLMGAIISAQPAGITMQDLPGTGEGMKRSSGINLCLYDVQSEKGSEMKPVDFENHYNPTTGKKDPVSTEYNDAYKQAKKVLKDVKGEQTK